MPNQPQAARSTGKNKSAPSPKGRPAPAQKPIESAASDEMYGVVSVLYHALQGADTYDQYIEDAEAAGDDELVTFFEECREEELRRAARAKALLAARLTDEGADDEDEDEDDEDDDEDEDEDEDDEGS